VTSASAGDQDLAQVHSPYEITETISRLEECFRSHGLTLFARIDHGAEASKIGLTLHPARRLILGNPRPGTPFMIASPTIAIDLPSKALVWEDAGGNGLVTDNKPGYIQRRHSPPDRLVVTLCGITALVQKALA